MRSRRICHLPPVTGKPAPASAASGRCSLSCLPANVGRAGISGEPEAGVTGVGVSRVSKPREPAGEGGLGVPKWGAEVAGGGAQSLGKASGRSSGLTCQQGTVMSFRKTSSCVCFSKDCYCHHLAVLRSL